MTIKSRDEQAEDFVMNDIIPGAHRLEAFKAGWDAAIAHYRLVTGLDKANNHKEQVEAYLGLDKTPLERIVNYETENNTTTFTIDGIKLSDGTR